MTWQKNKKKILLNFVQFNIEAHNYVKHRFSSLNIKLHLSTKVANLVVLKTMKI